MSTSTHTLGYSYNSSKAKKGVWPTLGLTQNTGGLFLMNDSGKKAPFRVMEATHLPSDTQLNVFTPKNNCFPSASVSSPPFSIRIPSRGHRRGFVGVRNKEVEVEVEVRVLYPMSTSQLGN